MCSYTRNTLGLTMFWLKREHTHNFTESVRICLTIEKRYYLSAVFDGWNGKLKQPILFKNMSFMLKNMSFYVDCSDVFFTLPHSNVLHCFILLNRKQSLYIQYISLFRFILMSFFIYGSEKECYSKKKIFSIYEVWTSLHLLCLFFISEEV